jgi:hypothetical protein
LKDPSIDGQRQIQWRAQDSNHKGRCDLTLCPDVPDAL